MVHKIPSRGSFSVLNHHLYVRWKSSHWAGPFHKLLIDITTVFHHLPLALRKVTAEPGLFSCINQLHVNTEILSCSSDLPANLPRPPPQINPFLPHFSLPLWHRYTGRGFSKGSQLSKGGPHYDYLNFACVRIKVPKPDLQPTVPAPIWRDSPGSKGLTTSQWQAGGQKAKRKDLAPGTPQKLNPCLPTPTPAITLRTCWHKTPSKPSYILTETPCTHTVQFPVGINAGDNLCSAH